MKQEARDQRAIAVIKGLVMDATRKANSGHPGGPMSMADYAYILFKEYLVFDPDDPRWFNRDRFVLSAGHASMLLYSLLTFVGYLDLDDLKQFRQWGSRTPGHPEVHLTPGVEATTGPLGQGLGMAVGMAIAETLLRHQLGEDVVNHFTYVIASDGDFQEPIGLGAGALAGHLGLGRLKVFYDYNEIQISGSTHRADSTDYRKVFEGFGWQVLEINGHDHQQIRQALQEARSQLERPTLILAHTRIAKDAFSMEGLAETHGAPLPPEEIQKTKEKLGLPPEQSFYLPDDVLQDFRSRFPRLRQTVRAWKDRLAKKQQDPVFRTHWNLLWDRNAWPEGAFPTYSPGQAVATRSAFGKVLALLGEKLPNLVGGSADLEPSNNTREFMEKVGDFSRTNPSGRNLVFGVREFPMGAILNGMALHGGIRPFGATFLVFSDYERAAIRLSALQELPVLHVFTHDSIFLGEDGPTHQPVEHMASLRAMPNLLVIRPADAPEVAEAMRVALEQTHRPTALLLTRQKVPVLERPAGATPDALRRGAYIIFGDPQEKPELIIIATGSEVHLAVEAARQLSEWRVRVVNMPCMELFEEQSEDYRSLVLPPDVRRRVAIEAGVSFGWERYVGTEGLIIGVDRFGASAPAGVLAEKFGFTVDQIVSRIRHVFKK
ncbi:MAG: transketolase [Calditrichaeota bacterium]|nr:transketolase [Calditrichota bacterium]